MNKSVCSFSLLFLLAGTAFAQELPTSAFYYGDTAEELLHCADGGKETLRCMVSYSKTIGREKRHAKLTACTKANGENELRVVWEYLPPQKVTDSTAEPLRVVGGYTGWEDIGVTADNAATKNVYKLEVMPQYSGNTYSGEAFRPTEMTTSWVYQWTIARSAATQTGDATEKHPWSIGRGDWQTSYKPGDAKITLVRTNDSIMDSAHFDCDR